MEVPPPCSGGGRRGLGKEVSARKLAASLWKSAVTADCNGGVRWRCGLSDGLGFEFCSAASVPKSWMEGSTKWDYVYSEKASATNTKSLNEDLLQRRPKRSKEYLEEQVSSPLTTVHNSNKTYAKLMREMKLVTRNFEKERKIRELLEDLCIQQSNEIEDNKVEIRNLCAALQKITGNCLKWRRRVGGVDEDEYSHFSCNHLLD